MVFPTAGMQESPLAHPSPRKIPPSNLHTKCLFSPTKGKRLPPLKKRYLHFEKYAI